MTFIDAMTCKCGCGQWAPECHDPDSEGEYRVEASVCQAGAELDRWWADHPTPEPGTVVMVRRRGADEIDDD